MMKQLRSPGRLQSQIQPSRHLTLDISITGSQMTTPRSVAETEDRNVDATLKKREALRKRAIEAAAERKQRKAYSSPLYSSLKDKRQKVRFQTPDLGRRSGLPRNETDLDLHVTLPKETLTSDGQTEDDTEVTEDSTDDNQETSGADNPVNSTESREQQTEPETDWSLREGEYVIISRSEVDVATAAMKVAEAEHREQLQMSEEMRKRREQEKAAALAAALAKEEADRLAEEELKNKKGSEDNSKLVTQVIPTVGDTRTGPLSLTVDDRPASRGQSPSGKRRFSIIKKERADRRRVGAKADSPVESPAKQLPNKRATSWIYGSDDDDADESSDAGDKDRKSEVDEVPPLPTDVPPPLPDPDSINKASQKTSDKRRRAIHTPIVQKLEKKLKRRQFTKDSSYEEELRKQELAEQRRQKHMEMLEKARARKQQGDMGSDGGEDGPNFDDYGFLAKYCIFNKANVEMFKHTFDNVDDEKRGWLSATEVMVALRAINNKLSHAEEEYLYRILELTGYSIKNGADFKLFSVVAALSQKITALDNWMRNMIGKMDFSMLEMKLFMCKKLWECNVDHDTNKISIDQLCVELRAGGVSLTHETEVRDKLSHLDALDLLDFLTYIPLFIMIHQSVVDNPLDDTRNK